MGDEQAIRARLAAATPGKWLSMVSDGGQPCVGTVKDDVAWVDRVADAHFIAHAPEDVRLLLTLLDAARAEREAAEPCAGCGQPFTPVADSCLCRTCDAGLRESNERTYQWQRDALARLRAALVLIGGHLSTVDTSRHWLVKQRGIRRLVFRALGVEAITPEMLACALLDASELAAPVLAPGREEG